MGNYIATFTDKNGDIVSDSEIKADSLKAAKAIAQSHKRHIPEIKRAKGVKVSVRAKRANIILPVDHL